MSEQNFFENIAPLLEGLKSLSIVLRKNQDTIFVSILPAAGDVQDKAASMIPPLNLWQRKGTG